MTQPPICTATKAGLNFPEISNQLSSYSSQGNGWMDGRVGLFRSDTKGMGSLWSRHSWIYGHLCEIGQSNEKERRRHLKYTHARTRTAFSETQALLDGSMGPLVIWPPEAERTVED